jgi:CDP-diacylglycerol--glycerol-3-phosphate 3-phosphatidyltransferase
MKILNLPNQITISRIALVPVMVLLLMFPGKWTCFFAGLFFIIAACTDLVDGYLARKDNQITSFGKFLDPLADKILVSSMLVMLVQNGWIPGWIAIVIICRDIMVTGLRAIAADEGIVIAADVYGKLKTVLQLVAITPLIFHYPLFGIPVHSIGIFLLYIALALTVFSGCNYFFNFYREWKRKAEEQGQMGGGSGI